MRVSLTTFIDFTAANGTSRTGVVSRAKDQSDDYDPAADFYRGIRNAIIDTLHDDEDKDMILKSADTAYVRRVKHYRECAEGFVKWWGRKSISWIENPKPQTWSSGELEVQVNPELLIDIDGEVNVIKMYFKAQAISKRRIDATLYLLESMWISGEADKVGVLDVRRSKLFTPPIHTSNIDAYLVGEAAAFAAMWNALP